MSLYLAATLLFFVAILQTTLAHRIAFMGATPQFMLLTVILWSFLRDSRQGALWGFIGGLILDLMAGGSFGVITLSMVLLGYLASSGHLSTVLRQNVVLPLTFVAIATLCYNVAILIALEFGRPSIDWERAFVNVVLPAVLLNLVTLPVIYFPLRYFHRLSLPPQMKW